MYEICAKAFLEGTFMSVPRFLVCTHLMTCVRAQLRENTDYNHIIILSCSDNLIGK